ncbi:MAG: HAD family phosphatase [Clostridia bacterium]|nr:HAD family phosphatase [Clostridia bacterium]
MNIQAAIFDLDGTLINSIIFWDLFWKELGEKYLHQQNFTPDRETELKMRTMLFTDCIACLKEQYSIEAPHREMLDHFNDLLFRFYRDEVQVKPGVLPWLEHLKKNNIKMCIASASARDLIAVAMEHCGLEPYISTVLTCADVGKGKDQPDVYQLALDTLGTPKETTWVFEDSFVALTTAHRFGLKTVAVYDAGEPRQQEMQATADLYIAPGEGLNKLAAGSF